MVQSMRAQRVGHDLVTEQQQSILELLSKEFFNPRVLLPGLVLKAKLNKIQSNLKLNCCRYGRNTKKAKT